MADSIDDLAECVQAVEEKVDRLSSQVDERFDAGTDQGPDYPSYCSTCMPAFQSLTYISPSVVT